MAGQPASKASPKPVVKASKAAGGDTPVAVSEVELTREKATRRSNALASQAARSTRMVTSGATPMRIGGPVVPRPGCTKSVDRPRR